MNPASAGAKNDSNRSRNSIPAELYFKSGCTLGEGPVWDAGTLYWTDISGKSIFAKRDESKVPEKYELPLEVGCLVPWKNQQLILATEHGFQLFDLGKKLLEPWADPEKGNANVRFNDGKCDPRGRFVAGTISRQRKPEAALYLLDHDRSVRELLRPLTNSNGLAWSEDGKSFYHIDTPTRCVRSYAYDLETGRLTDEQVVTRIPESHGKPDGMTIDRAGNLWIALWGGWGIECWNPVTGEQLARIELPVANVTCCTFGGDNLDTLFITTARQGLDEAALAKQELAGSIFCARPGVSGFPANHFRDE